MSPGEQIIQLFLTVPPPGSNLDWFADRLLAIAAGTSAVTIRLLPDLDDPAFGRRMQIEEPGRVLSGGRPSRLRVFRPLLARLAVMAAQETGTEFQPYGGRYSLTRPGPDGPVRLDVEFSNTPGSQHLSFTRAPVGAAPAPASANGAAPPPQPAEPAGA